MSAATTADVCVGLCDGTNNHADGHCVQADVNIPTLHGNRTDIAAYAYPAEGLVGVYIDGVEYTLDGARRFALALLNAVDDAGQALTRLNQADAR